MGFEVAVVEVYVVTPRRVVASCLALHHREGRGCLDRHVHAAVLAELVPTPTADDVPLTLRFTAGEWYIDALVCCG